MWLLRLLCAGFYFQATACSLSCHLKERRANCRYQNHFWVPSLPPNITKLDLEGNFISEINSTSLRAYEELQELNLMAQKQALVIRNNSFLGQKSLTHLFLTANIGLVLEPRAFKGLISLQNLFLENCALSNSILSENYLEPLLSLQMLNLDGNRLTRVQPGLFFQNLTEFTKLHLKLNNIGLLCEDDLAGFRGKLFTLLDLQSNTLLWSDVDWESCGNPFKEVAFTRLDLSTTGLNVKKSKQLFKAIKGTPVDQLKYSGSLGKSSFYHNLPDPDQETFVDLRNSSIRLLDLSGNWISSLSSGIFSPLKDVIVIDVSNNKINQIERNAFTGIEGNLKGLNLSFNVLGLVFPHTFDGLRELVLLDLSYNNIGALGHGAFGGLPRLQELVLTGNSLRQLKAPGSLPSLNRLFLSYNKLTSCSGVTEVAKSCLYLDISHNMLTNIEDVYVIVADLPHLQSFNFGANTIRWCTLNEGVHIPYNASLKVLDLHGSSLQLIWAQRKCLNLFDHLNNLLGLNISLNFLANLPDGIFRGLDSIYEIDLSSNALTYLKQGVFPPSLKILHLSNNFLSSPDPMLFQNLLFISLQGNRFHCDCSLGKFLEWFNRSDSGSPQDYRCEFPSAVYNLTLQEYHTMPSCEEVEEKAVEGIRFALFISMAILVFSVILGGIAYAHLRGRIFIIYKRALGRILDGPKPAANEKDAQYDTFICFSDSDYRWVEAALLERLDKQFSEKNLFRCCFEARDFLPGEDHLSNIQDTIWGSRKTLCVISKEFLKDSWCLEAFSLAQGRMLEELSNILIVLVVGKVRRYELMKYSAIWAFITQREYLTWPEDPQDLEWFYERLVSHLLLDTKLNASPEEKPRKDREEIELENR